MFGLILNSQCDVQIRKIETQAGYTILQGDPLNIISGYTELMHVINLDDFEDTIHKLKTGISQYYNVNDGWLMINLNRKIGELEHLLQTLKMHVNVGNRNKRALIDAGGRLINWIFGNMDDEDRLRIEGHFKEIDFNQMNMINNLNKQVKINTEMQTYLQNIRLVLEQNKNWFNRTYMGSIEDNLKMTKYNSFMLLINEVKHKIEQVQENIVMSKYKIASKFFLTNEEIDHFEIDNLKLRFIKSNIGQVDHRMIVFVLSIPTFLNYMYKTQIVLPIPDRSYMQLNIKITKTVNIDNVTYLVDNENVLNKMKSAEKCISSIMNNHYNNCSKIKMNKIEINEIEIGNLLLINIDDNMFDSCSNFSYPLQGHYLIKFDKCEISIDNYKILRFESRLNTIIPSINKLPGNITEILPDINMTNVSEISKFIKEKKSNHNYYIIYTLLFIIILYYFLRKLKNCIGIRRDSNLNGGEVICEAHIPNPIHSPMSLSP